MEMTLNITFSQWKGSFKRDSPPKNMPSFAQVSLRALSIDGKEQLKLRASSFRFYGRKKVK